MSKSPPAPEPQLTLLRRCGLVVAAVRRAARRGGILVIGWCLLGAGVALMPTPLPIGLLLMLAGLAVLARESETARNGIQAARRRVPVLSRALNRVKPRLPVSLREFVESTDPIAEAAAGE